ncbi:MAG: recombinase family protein [Phenylobacterium sp.]|uniref:recombinase family protein n=1 Tax=Phenylobacterium sp. TaxID=1871053 RepID=UPI00271D3195|nr:recombinase family protein [Phenylobacterium sp.]MDO8912754.1 recombinase family protein [Phenylobacterium sp.]MDP3102020.1 recombinase family protein [Phenylobacterium sp.]
MSPRLRCAIYTRKSSEEGLEQNFNSLHAQRESCEAYVLSQTGEGWTAIKTAYDDGGYSGGSMERPGLKQLMTDIAKGLVDIVVVYKVDRLTRSLADFAKIVELFDAKGVSFVSVTQAFNTTSSMGRLTLNVLLSFAQFEREVTGERIRDKVAASKAKGLRMGGRPPLGYDIVEGRLALNLDEAPRARRIFERYLALGSLHALEREGVQGKRWINKAGVVVGGGAMTRGSIYYLLTNPAYRGITRHKDKRYDDTHVAIVDQDLWDAVQAKLSEGNASQPKTEMRGEGARLEGLVFDDRNNPMVAVHTKRGMTRYRYYLSRAKLTGKGEAGSLHRISAGVLEQFLAERLGPMLSPAWRPDDESIDRITRALRNAVLSQDQLVVCMLEAALSPDAVGAPDVTRLEDGVCSIRLSFHMRRQQGAMILEAPGGGAAPAVRVDRALVRAIVLAKVWAAQLEIGEVESITALARRERLCTHYSARLLPLAYLAPDIVEQIVEGRQPRAATLAALTARALPLDWADQRDLLQRL